MIVAAIPALQEYAKQHGEVPDSVMQDKIPKDVLKFEASHGRPGSRSYSGAPIDMQVENRRRTIWLNHHEVAQVRAAKVGAQNGAEDPGGSPSTAPAGVMEYVGSTQPSEKRSATGGASETQPVKAGCRPAAPVAASPSLVALHPLSSFGRKRAAPAGFGE